MSVGISYLEIPVPHAQPLEPDVAEKHYIPGGTLVRCSPFPVGSVPTVNRTDYRLAFPFTQGQQLTVRRIAVDLPVLFAEKELEKQTSLVAEESENNSEAIAIEKAKTYVIKQETIRSIGYAQRFEREFAQTIASNFAGSKSSSEVQTTTERSVIPVSVQVVARLTGPDGLLWSESFDVAIQYVEGPAGTAIGTGRIGAYSDLNNGIELDGSKVYGLGFSVFVPASVRTGVHLGLVMPGAVPGNGAVTLFYDIETVPVGK